jgi:predicted lipid carrier protein YhbT
MDFGDFKRHVDRRRHPCDLVPPFQMMQESSQIGKARQEALMHALGSSFAHPAIRISGLLCATTNTAAAIGPKHLAGGSGMTEREKGELPGFVRALTAPSRLLPLGLVLTLALRGLAKRRPALFDRLGEHARRSFVIEPSDMAFAFVMVPDGAHAEVRTVARGRAAGDVHVLGPLLALLGLLDGTFDGDALFFNRAITVSGRTDALLALRNAIEDAELRPSDLLGLEGRAGTLADASILRVVGTLQRLTGLQPDGMPS